MLTQLPHHLACAGAPKVLFLDAEFGSDDSDDDYTAKQGPDSDGSDVGSDEDELHDIEGSSVSSDKRGDESGGSNDDVDDESDESGDESSDGSNDDVDDDVPLIDVVNKAGQVDASSVDDVDVKHTHNGVVGAASPNEFMIEYNCGCSDCAREQLCQGPNMQDKCFLLHTDDFDALHEPPGTTRDELGWDHRIVSKQLVFLWGKPGYTGWYGGRIVAYDVESQDHEITPFDATRVIKANLLKGKQSVIKEWRFLRDGEDEVEVCSRLNQ